MGDRAPAFQFYPKDYESDENVKQMTLEQEGAYLRLLCHGWLHRSIPSDVPALARICRVPTAKMNRLWPGISPCFKPNEAGRLVNPRQEKERAKQEAFRVERSKSGKKGAAVRHGSAKDLPRVSDGSATVLPQAKSSFPSPSAVSVSGRTDERPSGLPTDAPKPNPFIADLGGKDAAALEALRLVREICALTGEDGAEVMAEHARYEGAAPGRQKTNPANMTDDRLVNTILDLRATLKAEREKRAKVGA